MGNINNRDLWAVILAGGSGRRLWPLSRTSFPKQFIDLHDSGSLLASSIERASGLNNLKQILDALSISDGTNAPSGCTVLQCMPVQP